MTSVISVTAWKTPHTDNETVAAQAHARGLAAYMRECGWEIGAVTVNGQQVPPRDGVKP